MEQTTKVEKIKEELMRNVHDLVFNFEENDLKSNMAFFVSLGHYVNDIQEAINEEKSVLIARNILSLDEKTKLRNKLNREIATLKKATLKQ